MTTDDDDGHNQNGSSEDPVDDPGKTNLIVNYLPQHMTDSEFENLFQKYGRMKSCKIVRNRMTGYSYGFGFVDFDTHEQALKAIEELNGYEVDTKKIKVAFARPAGQDIKQANLYVKNVSNSWSQDDVRKVFEPYGKIIQVRVLGNDRGVAFVLFDLRRQAEEAMEALNGKQVEGCDAPFEIKFAADKKEKRGNKSPGEQTRNTSGRRERQRGGRNRNRGHSSQSGGANRSGGGRLFNKGNNNNNNNSNSNNNNSNTSNNNNGNNSDNLSKGGVGPMRQQSNSRMNRYAPFAPMQQQPMIPQPVAMPINPYGYAQQPVMPYMMPGQSAMMPFNPMAQQPMQMGAPPVVPYSIATSVPQMTPMGYSQPAPIAQPSASMSNMYNVASNTLNNAAQMQPQLGQPMNLRGSTGTSGHNFGGSGGGGSSSGGSSGGASDGITLFVYNIGPNSDDNELRTLFGAYGDVVRCNVVRKTPGGETKGFGFVTMRTKDQASAAIACLNGEMRNGKPLQVSFKK